MAAEEVQIDQYSGFDHKEAMDSAQHQFWLSPMVPKEDRRRMMSYVVARSIHENVSRRLLPAGASVADFDEIREYGDPQAYASAVAGGILGTDILFSVKGADLTLPDQPVLPHAPEPPAEPDDQGVLQAAHDAQVEVWRQKSFDIIDKWKKQQMEQPNLLAAQEWLRDWADSRRVEMKLREAYKDVVQPMGDGIIQLHVVPGQLPDIEIWDPESYFPDFDDGMTSEFPTRVCLGYEYEDEDGAQWFRRVKYELVPLVERDTGRPASRKLDYQADRTNFTCVMTDASFKLDGTEKDRTSVHDLVDGQANYVATVTNARGEEVPVMGLDLGIDFIPVLHLPAGPASRTHFGRSVYLRGAQLFDDIYQADTSIMSAANLAGNPPLVVSGAIVQTDKNGRVAMGPGKVFSTPDSGGSIDKLEMSSELRALMEHRGELRKRAAQNMQVPEGVMGQASPEKIASGITLELTFTPFQRIVMEGRLAVDPKLALLLKMAMRLAVVAKSPGWEAVADIPKAYVQLGSFMPTDLPSLVEMISVLRSAKVLTRKVAATWLQAAGMNIEDVDQLLNELDGEDTEKALDLEAMFGAAVAAKSLGIELDEEALEERRADEEASGLGRFGTSLDRGRARPQLPAVEGEDLANQPA